MDLWIESLIRLIAAAFLGGLIGLERELSHKPAGLRTNMLICSGSALFMIVSQLVAGSGTYSGDPGRIAAQVVAGIGFLGAGVIVHSRGSVVGVTTGATIFVIAAIGLAVGGGYYVPAAAATLIVIVSLLVLGKLEKAVLPKNQQSFFFTITTADVQGVLAELRRLSQEQKFVMESISAEPTEDGFRLRFTIQTTPERHEKIVPLLLTLPGAVRVELPGDAGA